MLEQTETQVAYRPVSGIMAEISGVHKGRKENRVNHPFPASLSSSVWSHWWLVSYMPIPRKATLLYWAIELQASWQLLEVEILFFIWNKRFVHMQKSKWMRPTCTIYILAPDMHWISAVSCAI